MTNTQKTALITGATGGIGWALVRAFCEAGYRVIASDRYEKPADLTCAYYQQADLVRYVQDEAYSRDIDAALRSVLDGRLDVLINNAALQILGGVDSLTRQDWHQILDVNLLAPFLLTQSRLSELETAKGVVINIGSIHARLTKKNFVAYATSKAALASMTRAIAVDIGPRVRINAIEPAAIETSMLKAGFEGKPELYAQLKACHPQQHIGLPEEVAHLAIVIAGEGMNFLHGACISMDGGISGRLFDPD